MDKITISNKDNLKKVSCICVTKKRSDLLLKSIKYFNNQTYPNKELIIVYYSDDDKTKKNAINNKNAKILFYEYNPSQKLSFGLIRNKAISYGSGDYICIWDDDDWYDKNRIIKQYCYIIANDKPACSLKQLTIFDYETREFSVTCVRKEGWEGSLMCKKDIFIKHGYGDLNRGEDTFLFDSLRKNDLISSIDDYMLYIYVFHSSNTSNREHLEKIKFSSKKLKKCEEKYLNDQNI